MLNPDDAIVMSSGLSQLGLEDYRFITESLRYQLEVWSLPGMNDLTKTHYHVVLQKVYYYVLLELYHYGTKGQGMLASAAFGQYAF